MSDSFLNSGWSSLPSTVYELITAQERHDPDATAVLEPGHKTLTYRRLREQIEYVVNRLNSVGIGRNDRVGLILPNGPDMAVAFLATAAGATSVPLSSDYRENELNLYLSNLAIRALIIEPDTLYPARDVAAALEIPIIELLPMPEAGAGSFSLDVGNVDSAKKAICGYAAAEDIALVLLTSGTTSRPKIVPLSHKNICASAQHVAAALQLTGRDRCLNVMPLFHAHGLIAGMLASVATGGSVVCTSGFTLSKFFEWLDELLPTWFTAVPTIHQAVLTRSADNQSVIDRCPIRLIRSATSPLPPKVMLELEATFNAPVIESYGMTETATQITSNPLPPHQRKPGSAGLAAGPEVAIRSSHGDWLPPGQSGEIVVRGPNVMQAYESNPEANQTAFVNGWFRTGDQGYLDSDGYLYLTGRLKEMINRGGEKVAPREIDEVLLGHPEIAQAVTFAVPHSSLGEDVAAAIVLRDGASLTEKSIRAFAIERLADYKVPSQVLIVDAIPKGCTGKLERIGLAELLGERLDRHYVAPRNELEQTVADVFSEVLGLDRIGINGNFFALGGDSLRAAQVLNRVNAICKVELPISSLFTHPSVSELAQNIAGLRNDSSVNTSIYMPENSQIRTEYPEVRKEIRSSGSKVAVQLTFDQWRMWFRKQMDPDSAVHNVYRAYRLRGKLDIVAMTQALNELVSRHKVLCARFSVVDNQPIQFIDPTCRVYLPVIDISGKSAESRESEALTAANAEIRKPFDLERGPLYRTILLRLTDLDYVLVATLHHIVCDGLSMGIFARDLMALYEAQSQGRPSELADLPIQYTDYAEWQRDRLKDEFLEKDLCYWKNKLEGLSPLELPTDRFRPAVPSFLAAQEIAVLDESLFLGLDSLCKREGVSLFMILLATFDVLLSRYTGQKDIALATPFSRRDLPEIKEMIGLFINTLVLRVDLSGDPTFKDLLARVRETALDAYAHSELPFEKLVEEIKPVRQHGRNPIVDTMINAYDASWKNLKLSGMIVDPIELNPPVSEFDWILQCTKYTDGLQLKVIYQKELFDAGTITRMISHYQILLEGIVTDPAQRISALPMLTKEERAQLVMEWNDTARDYPQKKGIHELFEAWAVETPNATAVIFDNRQMTYAELNGKANQLAHYLMGQGVGPEILVGISVERSLEMVVGILGILKAGGAYVPLDPDYPKDRLSLMIDDACISILITQERLLTNLPPLYAKAVCLDKESEVIARQDIRNPKAETTADNLAYVVYTSGSTGVPKGVMVSHHAVCNYLFWRSEYMPLTNTDRLLQKTSLSFDVSVWEIFEPLMVGAQMILARPDGHHDTAYLARLIAEYEITAVSFVPSMLKAFLEESPVESCKSLRRVNVGGEVLSGGLQDLLFKKLPGVQLYNGYGPTEATIGAVYWQCHNNRRHKTVPIGRPIANTQVYILDSQLNPMPVGVSGELYIGGDGLARGYLNRPELTAEKFIHNPFSEDPEAHLYKTGDLARYLPDGNIEFIGRIDHQVKIRGFRIELGEIEATLAQHPSVLQSVVILREDAPGDKRLVAYAVPAAGRALSNDELRANLRSKLPNYMIPSAFVILPGLPLTPTGKLDRNALPIPSSYPDAGKRYVAPATTIEKQVAEIWEQVLGLERIGLHDNFFELGGHSLQAGQLVSRLSRVFQVDLSMRILFDFPTVAELATTVLELLHETEDID